MKQKNNKLISITLIVFAIIGTIWIVVSNAAEPTTSTTSTDMVRIAAAGDWGSSAEMQANMRNARDGADILYNLGDLSYSSTEGATTWCNIAKTNLGSTGMLMTPGDHDTGADTGALLQDLLPCLPAKPAPPLATEPVGKYPLQWYVDVKGGLARIINIATAMQFGDLTLKNEYSPYVGYKVGSTNYQWLSNTIDDARAKGVKWIIVGQQWACYDVSTKKSIYANTHCQDVLNLLVQKKVDLMVTADTHTYWRNKQLTNTNSGCSSLVVPTSNTSPASVNTACISTTQTKDTVKKGDGLVGIQVGTGGRSSYGCTTTDNEIPYVWMDTCTQTYGLINFEITQNEIKGKFITYTKQQLDSFSIVDPAPQPPQNIAPSATLTSPAQGSIFTAPANISLSASAADSDGTISKVEFFNGSTKLGEDTTAPYTFTWSNVNAGSYSLTARASDNGGATGSSQAIAISVQTPVAKRCDFNADGKISAADLAALLANYTKTVSPSTNGDCNGDGRVTISDLGELLAVYGT